MTANAPKRPQAGQESSRKAPDDASITGSRRGGTTGRRSSSGDADARLETFEQEPRRGTEDARLQQDVPDDIGSRPE